MNAHSRDSAYRLADYLIELFSLSAQKFPDDYYNLVETIQKDGAIAAYYSLLYLTTED